MIESFFKSKVFLPFEKKVEEGHSFQIEGLWQAPKTLLAAIAALSTKRQVLIITALEKENIFLSDLANSNQIELLNLPAWETLPTEGVEPSPDIAGERAQVFTQILKGSEKQVIVASLQALLVPVLVKEEFQSQFIALKDSSKIAMNVLIEKLVSLGYLRVSLVNDKGQFAVRGGIIDVFPSTEVQPFRIEFFGDEIESMRAFDPINQTSVSVVKELKILANKELASLQAQEKKESFFSYLKPNALIFIDQPHVLKNKYQELAQFFEIKGDYIFDFTTLSDQLEGFQKIIFQDLLVSSLYKKLPKWDHPFKAFDEIFPSKTKIIHENDQTYLIKLPQLGFSDYTFHYLCQNEAEEKTLKDHMILEYQKLPPNIHFHQASFSSSWVLYADKQAYISSAEVTQHFVVKRKKQRASYHAAAVEFMELQLGDYVVHLQHGIGKYLGCERRVNHMGVETEFLTLEYADGAKLYVPLDQSHLVSKYIGAKHETPKLHQIGGKVWLRTKVETERAILDYAAELLQLYAQRAIKEGNVYPQDTLEMQLFEKEFPYTETVDQQQAISAIKEDLTSSKPMDRLICGDVGYGKTEVAMRAAFKAVVDGGFQVAVLVPTTILAMQHYESFCQRMSNFPVKIACLSRFVSPKEQKEAILGLQNGTIDIVIGTHRVISKDVQFKRLGLVIIDEEQRFGVKAKEQLKALKIGVDCLTLSATPIPRTLYMSIVGARDISLINSPPQDRLPIKTEIIESEPQKIRQAILREILREGQVYMIHNRVASIYRFAEKIQKLVPEAKILIAHGQMGADELDEVFHDFKSRKADILIATTIIESGVDIPNANTILIDNADTYGLADLYQLRGRVGRWNRKAYAYFMVQQNKSLLEMAQKRLAALLESSGYGGGMKIAMRDLEIRGAGEILGTSQSGQISSVGFHLYCKLLKRTILAMQGKAPKTIVDTKMEFPIDCRIPEDYVPDMTLRMELYQRLGDAFEMEQVEIIYNEILDRFGKPPMPMRWLYHTTRLKIFAGARRYLELIYKKNIIKATQRVKGEEKVSQIPYVMPKEPELFEKELISVLKEC